MKNKSRYISAGQTAVMISAFALTFLTTAAFDDCGAALSDALSAVLLTALLAVPVAAVTSRYKGSITDIIGKFAGRSSAVIAAVLYILYFIPCAAHLIRVHSIFAAERYFDGVRPYVCIILTGLVCIYISGTGVETVCRMSTMLLGLTVLTLGAFALFSADDISMPQITPYPLKPIPADISSAGLFPFLAAAVTSMCIVSGGAEERTRKGIYTGIAAVLAGVCAVILLIFAVLGDFAPLSSFPLSDAVIYASRDMPFRPDGLLFTLSVLSSLCAASLLCACAGKALGTIFPRLKGAGVYTSAAAVIFSAVCEVTHISAAEEIFSSIIYPVVLLGLVPLAAVGAAAFAGRKKAVKVQ